MAQYFYDLSIGRPEEWPYLMRGESSNPKNASVYSAGPGYVGEERAFIVNRTNDNIWLAIKSEVIASNVEVLLKLVRLRRQTDDFINTGGGVLLRTTTIGGSAGDGYYLSLGSAGSSSIYRAMSLYRRNASSQTLLSSVNNYLNDNPDQLYTPLYLRARAEGSSLFGKAWWSHESEPAQWGITATDSNWSEGDCGILLHGREALFGLISFSMGTDGDPAPMEYPGGNRVVAGTVYKPDDTIANGYIVRCYHRATGAMLGETLSDESGDFSFSLPLPETEQVYCLAIDQLGNSWNAPIQDFVNPSIEV